MSTQKIFEISEVNLDRMEQRMSEALAEILMLCEPPKDNLDRINDLMFSILGEIDMIKDGS